MAAEVSGLGLAVRAWRAVPAERDWRPNDGAGIGTRKDCDGVRAAEWSAILFFAHEWPVRPEHSR